MKMNLNSLLENIIIEDSRYEVLMATYAEPKKKGKKARMGKDQLRLIMLADPTSKFTEDADVDDGEINKVGAYTTWILKQYLTLSAQVSADGVEYSNDKGSQFQKALIEKTRLFNEDLYKVTENLKKYNHVKKLGKFDDEKDIGKIKSFIELDDIVLKYDIDEDQMDKTKAERVRDDVDVGYEDDTWVIYIPKTEEASCHYGTNTSWCTAARGNRNYFTYYTDGSGGKGPLYMIMHKEDMQNNVKRGPARHVQFHFESNQYKDSNDREIELGNFLNENPGLKEYFKEMFKKFLKTSSSDVVSVNYPNDTTSKYIAIYGFEDFFTSLPDTLKMIDISGPRNSTIGFKLPDMSRFKQLETLHIESFLSELPESIGELTNLEVFATPNSKNLKGLPESIVKLKNLDVINVLGSGDGTFYIPFKILEDIECGGDAGIAISISQDKSFTIGNCGNEKIIVGHFDESGTYKTREDAQSAINGNHPE
jgi:hypothetical protein